MVLPLLAVTGLFLVQICRCRYFWIFGLLGFGLFYYGTALQCCVWAVPAASSSRAGPTFSLTIDNVAALPYGLAIGFAWWIPGFVLALAY